MIKLYSRLRFYFFLFVSIEMFLLSIQLHSKENSKTEETQIENSNKIREKESNKNGKNKFSEAEQKDTIVVTGTRRKGLLKDSTITTEVITRKDLDDMGAKDLSDALGNVPGIEVRPAGSGERGETVRLQGLSAQNVLILVDGQRTTGRFNGSIDLTRFKAEEIERIEIVKGSSSAIYGSDAIAGVINIITKEAVHPFSADFRTLGGTGSKQYFGQTMDFRNYASVGIKTNVLSTIFTAGWHKGEGYDLTKDATQGPLNGRSSSLSNSYNPYPYGMSKVTAYYLATKTPTYSPPLESTTGNAFNDLNISNKTIYHINDNIALTAQFYYRYLDQNGVDASPPKTVFDRKNKTHDFMGALNLDWIITQKMNLNLNANYSRFQDLYTSDQRKSDDLDTKGRLDNTVIEGRSRLDYKFSDTHVISFGAEHLLDSISSARISQDCKRNFPYVCLEDIRPELTGGQVINGYADRFRNAYYIQDEWRISDKPKIQIVPGIRYDRDSIYGGQWLPKFAIRYDIGETFRIRAATGLGYRAPSFQDLYFNFLNPGAGYRVAGNEELKPELSRTYNLGFEWDVSRRVWFSSNLFHNDVDNLIGFRTNPVRDSSGLQVYKTSNYLRAMTEGIESSVNLRITDYLSTGVGYTHTHTKDELTNLPLEGRGPNRWNLNIRAEHKSSGFGISVFAVAFGKQPYYCIKNPYWCNADLPESLNSMENEIASNASDNLKIMMNGISIPKPVSDYCTERNLSHCTANSTYGYRMVNAHTNLNIRLNQKFLSYFQWFVGVDNLLDAWDISYNSQKPRYYYFGLDTKFHATEAGK